jgi:hypothetical protein
MLISCTGNVLRETGRRISYRLHRADADPRAVGLNPRIGGAVDSGGNVQGLQYIKAPLSAAVAPFVKRFYHQIKTHEVFRYT